MNWKQMAVVAAFVLGIVGLAGAAWMFRYEPYVFPGYAQNDGTDTWSTLYVWDRWTHSPCRVYSMGGSREGRTTVECFDVEEWTHGLPY